MVDVCIFSGTIVSLVGTQTTIMDLIRLTCHLSVCGLRTLSYSTMQVGWNVIMFVNFNFLDGNYEVSYRSNVKVNHKGDVIYVPPAVYKSSCRMDVEYFPCKSIVFDKYLFCFS